MAVELEVGCGLHNVEEQEEQEEQEKQEEQDQKSPPVRGSKKWLRLQELDTAAAASCPAVTSSPS